MKKVVCIKDMVSFECKKGEIYDLKKETDNYWVIIVNNSEHYISKFFDEFMLLKDYRKLKLQKLKNESKM